MEHLTGITTVGSLTGWIGDFVDDASGLIQAILAVVGVIVAVLIIAKNPTIGRVIVGIMVGAFIASLPWILPAVGEMFRGDIEAAGLAPYALVVENLFHQAAAFRLTA